MSKGDHKKLGSLTSKKQRSIFWVYVFPILVSLIFLLMSFSAVTTKSGGVDEKFHLIRGVMLLETGDLRINQHHPYLFNLIHALPTLVDDDLKNPSTESTYWDLAMKDELAFEHVELNGGVTEYARNVLYWPRLLAAFITALFIALFYTLVRKEFGVFIAAVSTFLLAFSPTMLANGPLVTTDVPAMITIFLTTWFLYLWLKYKKSKMLGLFILLAFLTIITKYSALFFAPVWIIFVIIGFYKNSAVQKAQAGDKLALLLSSSLKAFAICLIWFIALTAAYKFQFATVYDMAYGREEKQAEISQEVGTDFTGRLADLAYTKLNLPFPQYINGFLDNVVFHDIYGHNSYLLGEFGDQGWWYYFPVSFALKETIPTVFLTLLSFTIAIYFFATKFRLGRKLSLESWLLIIIPALLMLLSMQSSINIGIRHILPIYPFLFILVAAMLYQIHKRVKIHSITVVVLALSFISMSLSYPNFLSYFNESIGGRENGYLYLRGSSYDWEQDFILQEKYVIEHSGENVVTDTYSLVGKGLLIQRKVTFFKEYEEIDSDRLKVMRKLYSLGELEPYEEVGDTLIVFEVDSDELDRLIPLLLEEEANEESQDTPL